MLKIVFSPFNPTRLIRPETIQTILELSRIEEVIGDFITLKKRGSNYLGLCPFHNEKTPSFSVSPAKGIYKCFGCGKAGNSVNFIMEHEHYSYPEALRYLAKRYNIEIEEEEMTAEMKQEVDERESMFTLNSFISKYFEENLVRNEEGKSLGLTYLKEREFIDATIGKFQLGYAIDGWEDYCKHALENGFKKEVLVKTGLAIERDDKLIDRFKGRVIFPIHNLTGKVIGFGGRILSSEKSTAKYINSPESDIYNKSKVLYGIYFSRNAIVKKDNCLLVEGYTDVISMHQAGIENVVASSGTSLTVDQIKLIRRFTPNITLLYDGDPAGIKASFRGIDLILEQGMNVKIVLFPEGHDPDSFVRSHSSSEVEDFISNSAADFIKFKTNLLIDETVGDPAGKAALIKEIVNTIAQIPDGISRSVYIKECSVVMEIPEQTLVNELNKILRRKFTKTTDSPVEVFVEEQSKQSLSEQIEIDPFDISMQETQLLRLLLLYGNEVYSSDEGTVAEFIIQDLKANDIVLQNPVFNDIVEEFSKAIIENQQLNDSYFTGHERQKIAKAAIELIATQHYLSENWGKNRIYVKTEQDQLKTVVTTTVLSLKAKIVSRRMKDKLNQMKLADDDLERLSLMGEYINLKAINLEINAELSRVISY